MLCTRGISAFSTVGYDLKNRLTSAQHHFRNWSSFNKVTVLAYGTALAASPFTEGVSLLAIPIIGSLAAGINSVMSVNKTAAVAHLTIAFFSASAIGYFSSLDLDSTNTPIPYCNRPDLWPKYEIDITTALNSCSATRKLGELAKEVSLSNNLPPWSIKIVPKFFQDADGVSSFFNGEVRIACETKEPVSTAAFELINFFHQNHFHGILNKALKGLFKTRDEYAMQIEKIEFVGSQRHHSLMDICMNEKNWQPSVKLWPKESWERAWSYRETSEHAQFYREQWDRMMDIFFKNQYPYS